MKEIKTAMNKISPHILGKCDKRYKEECVEMVQEDLVELVDTLLETQALALEGMKPDERKTATYGEWVAESYEDKMLVGTALQQAADHLRAQKITK